MNWMGGARNRMKESDEGKRRKEFFERNRNRDIELMGRRQSLDIVSMRTVSAANSKPRIIQRDAPVKPVSAEKTKGGRHNFVNLSPPQSTSAAAGRNPKDVLNSVLRGPPTVPPWARPPPSAPPGPSSVDRLFGEASTTTIHHSTSTESPFTRSFLKTPATSLTKRSSSSDVSEGLFPKRSRTVTPQTNPFNRSSEKFALVSQAVSRDMSRDFAEATLPVPDFGAPSGRAVFRESSGTDQMFENTAAAASSSTAAAAAATIINETVMNELDTESDEMSERVMNDTVTSEAMINEINEMNEGGFNESCRDLFADSSLLNLSHNSSASSRRSVLSNYPPSPETAPPVQRVFLRDAETQCEGADPLSHSGPALIKLALLLQVEHSYPRVSPHSSLLVTALRQVGIPGGWAESRAVQTEEQGPPTATGFPSLQREQNCTVSAEEVGHVSYHVILEDVASECEVTATSLNGSLEEGNNREYGENQDGVTSGYRNEEQGVTSGYRKEEQGVTSDYRKEEQGVTSGCRNQEQGVTNGYRNQEQGVTSGYRKEEQGVTSCYRKEEQGVTSGYRNEEQGVTSCYRKEEQGVTSGYRNQEQGVTSGYRKEEQAVTRGYGEESGTATRRGDESSTSGYFRGEESMVLSSSCNRNTEETGNHGNASDEYPAVPQEELLTEDSTANTPVTPPQHRARRSSARQISSGTASRERSSIIPSPKPRSRNNSVQQMLISGIEEREIADPQISPLKPRSRSNSGMRTSSIDVTRGTARKIADNHDNRPVTPIPSAQKVTPVSRSERRSVTPSTDNLRGRTTSNSASNRSVTPIPSAQVTVTPVSGSIRKSVTPSSESRSSRASHTLEGSRSVTPGSANLQRNATPSGERGDERIRNRSSDATSLGSATIAAPRNSGATVEGWGSSSTTARVKLVLEDVIRRQNPSSTTQNPAPSTSHNPTPTTSHNPTPSTIPPPSISPPSISPPSISPTVSPVISTSPAPCLIILSSPEEDLPSCAAARPIIWPDEKMFFEKWSEPPRPTPSSPPPPPAALSSSPPRHLPTARPLNLDTATLRITNTVARNKAESSSSVGSKFVPRFTRRGEESPSSAAAAVQQSPFVIKVPAKIDCREGRKEEQ